jgi:predicted MFS family arabinose efflux permease
MDTRVLAIAVGNFVTACGAFVVVGLLNEIAADLDVSVAVAGLLGAGFSATSCVLAPVAGILGSRISRRALLCIALGVNALCSFVSSAAPNFAILMASRMLLGGTVGAYVPASVSTASMLVPPERRGSAIFAIGLGASAAQVFGVPAGVWLGGELGWRVTLFVFGVLGALVALWQWRTVPPSLRAVPFDLRGWEELRRNKAILATLVVSALQAMGGMQTLTYLAPLLRDSIAATPGTISLMMGAFGGCGVLASVICMRIMDRVGPMRVSVVAFALITGNFVLLPLAHGSLPLTAVSLGLWGAGFMLIGSSQQTRMVMLNPKLAPVSVAFNTSCVFAGGALGASIGSVTITTLGLGAVTWVSLALVLAAAGVLVLTRPGTVLEPKAA